MRLVDDVTPDPRTAPALRWGVLGPGRIAASFGASVRDHTSSVIHAVASRDEARARAFAAEFGAVRVHAGPDAYAALAADPEVDAIYVATPHSHHRDHALLAIAGGKPVLVEKPMAFSAREAREIVDAARAAGVFAMEAMWTRFLPHMVEARRLVADGALGDVLSVSADFGFRNAFDPASRLFDPALAGGALLDIGVYPVHLVHDMLGAPESVSATGSLAPSGVDYAATVVLDYPGAAHAVAATSMLVDTPCLAVVAGTEARIEFDRGWFGPGAARVMRGDEVLDSFGSAAPLGWQYQAAEVAWRLEAGDGESPVLPLRATLDVLTVVDEARRQLGYTAGL